MSPHDPEQNPSIDEILSGAPLAVTFWLGEAEQILNDRFGPAFAEKNPEILAGFLAASVKFYAAERAIDAASMLAEAIEKARP